MCVHVQVFLGRFAVSPDTHVFPIQAWLAVLARLSLWEETIGRKSELGCGRLGGRRAPGNQDSPLVQGGQGAREVLVLLGGPEAPGKSLC